MRIQTEAAAIPDLPTQPLSLRNIGGLNWEWEIQQEHLAIASLAYELFEMRGREHGHDREDWFRAELELHLNESYKKGCQEKKTSPRGERRNIFGHPALRPHCRHLFISSCSTVLAGRGAAP